MTKLCDLPLEIVYRVAQYLDAKSINNVCSSSEKVMVNFCHCRFMMVESLMNKITDFIETFLFDLSNKAKISVSTKACWLNVIFVLRKENFRETTEVFHIDGLTGYILKRDSISYGEFAESRQLKITFYSHIDEYDPLKDFYTLKKEVKKRLNVDETLPTLWKKISKADKKTILNQTRKSPLQIKSINYDRQYNSWYQKGRPTPPEKKRKCAHRQDFIFRFD